MSLRRVYKLVFKIRFKINTSSLINLLNSENLSKILITFFVIKYINKRVKVYYNVKI